VELELLCGLEHGLHFALRGTYLALNKFKQEDYTPVLWHSGGSLRFGQRAAGLSFGSCVFEAWPYCSASTRTQLGRHDEAGELWRR